MQAILSLAMLTAFSMTFTGAGYSQSVVTVDIDPVDLKTSIRLSRSMRFLKTRRGKDADHCRVGQGALYRQKELELERKEMPSLNGSTRLRIWRSTPKKNFDAMKDVADRVLNSPKLASPKRRTGNFSDWPDWLSFWQAPIIESLLTTILELNHQGYEYKRHGTRFDGYRKKSVSN